MRILGYIDHPDRWEAVTAAPPFADIAGHVRSFIGDRALVAHNARFDASFLRAALGALPNPVVDTLELAHLLTPHLASHALADIAKDLGVGFEEAADLWTRLRSTDPTGAGLVDVTFAAESLHDANTDTCLLALTYRALLDRLDGPDGLDPAVRALLPELAGEVWTGPGPDATSFLRSVAKVLPPDLPPSPPILLPRQDEGAVTHVLDRFRSERGFSARAGQTEMALAVHRAFAHGRFGMIEAPTGTGKSIAYLVPAAIHAATTGERVLLSTAYTTLQDQLLEDLERLAPATGIPIRYQILKGLNHEICRTRVIRAVAELDSPSPLDERYALAVLLGWLAACPEADTGRFPYWILKNYPVAANLLDEASAANGGCGGSQCRALGCSAWRRAELAKGAHIVLVNHALWLADPERLPEATRLVVDEAHTLEDVATTALTEEASLSELRAATARLVNHRTGRGILPRLLARAPPPAVAAVIRSVFDAERVVHALARDYGDHVQTFVRRVSGKSPDRRYGATFRLEAPATRIAPTQWPSLDRASVQLYQTAIGDLLVAIANLRERLALLGDTAEAARADADLSLTTDALVGQQVIHLSSPGKVRRMIVGIRRPRHAEEGADRVDRCRAG